MDTEVKVASLGAPVRLPIGVSHETKEDENANNSNENGGGAAETPEAKAIREQAELATAEEAKLLDISDEQLQKIFKAKGIEGFTSIEEIKEKLAKSAQQKSEPTAEEIAAKELELDNKRFEVFQKNGGSIEQYAALKQLAAATDLTQLSILELKKEYKEKGFSDADVDVLLKERYYQIKEEEIEALEQGGTESDEDFQARKDLLKKKVAFGTGKINSRGEAIINRAKGVLDNLTKSIEDSNLQKREDEETEKKILSKVDEFFSKSPKEMSFELGKVADVDQLPVLFSDYESEIKEVQAILKDKSQRDALLYQENGDLNVEAIADILLKNKLLEKAVKASFIEGGNRQVAHFEKVFPHRSAAGVGLGALKTPIKEGGGKAKPVSFGKPVRVN